MDSTIKEVNGFLHEISMHPNQTDINALTETCISEMVKGLESEASSLKMIPTYVSVYGEPPEGKPVIAVDAGGTNLRIALVKFEDGKPLVTKMETYPIPGSLSEITADEFFGELADKILPLTNESSTIGFCFSYPAEIFPNRDGKILRLSKGVIVKDAVGLVIGSELKKKLSEKGAGQNFSFTLINDTVACMMGGAAEFPVAGFDGICGLIVGTGFNTCYAEKGENIKKLSDAQDMIINCETGNFSELFRGTSDEYTDASSENPGIGFSEKMVSGAYHGRVMSYTMQLAAKRGLLSKNFLNIEPPFMAPELDAFLRGEDNRVAKLCAENDEIVLREIIDKSFERAAKIVCAIVAAHCLHCDGGKTAERPYCVVAEGSTFYKSLLFKKKLDMFVTDYIEGKLSRHVVFKGADNLTLTGAALSALIN